MIRRIALTLLGVVVAFCLGFIVVDQFCRHFLVPNWIRQYPHDGQIGLAVFGYAAYGATFGAVAALTVGLIWIVSAHRREQSQKDTGSKTSI